MHLGERDAISVVCKYALRVIIGSFCTLIYLDVELALVEEHVVKPQHDQRKRFQC